MRAFHSIAHGFNIFCCEVVYFSVVVVVFLIIIKVSLALYYCGLMRGQIALKKGLSKE